MRVAEYRVLGLLPLRDDRKEVPLANRACVMAGTIDRRLDSGLYGIKGHAHSDEQEKSSGNLKSGFQIPAAPEGERPFGSWFFAMPAVAQTVSQTADTGTGSRTLSQQDAFDSAGRTVGVLPAVDASLKVDRGYKVTDVTLPPGAGEVAPGDMLLVMAGSDDDEQKLIGFPMGGGGGSSLKTSAFSGSKSPEIQLFATPVLGTSGLFGVTDPELDAKTNSNLASFWTIHDSQLVWDWRPGGGLVADKSSGFVVGVGARAVIGAMSHELGGPFFVPGAPNHRNASGVEPVHISTKALYSHPVGGFGDGPLNFEPLLYDENNIQNAPHLTDCHLVFEQTISGGVWRWVAEAYFAKPKHDEDPPPKRKKKKKKKKKPKGGGGGDDDDDDDEDPKDCQTTPGGGGTGDDAEGPDESDELEELLGDVPPGGGFVGAPGGLDFVSGGLDQSGAGVGDGGQAEGGVNGAASSAAAAANAAADAEALGVGALNDGFDDFPGAPGHRGGDTGHLSPEEARKEKGQDGVKKETFSWSGEPTGTYTTTGYAGGLSDTTLDGLYLSGVMDAFGRPIQPRPPRVGDSTALQTARGHGPGTTATSTQTMGFQGGIQIFPAANTNGQTDFTGGGFSHNELHLAGGAGAVGGLTAIGSGDGSWGGMQSGGKPSSGGVMFGPPEITDPINLDGILNGTYVHPRDDVGCFYPEGLGSTYYGTPNQTMTGVGVQGTGVKLTASATNGGMIFQPHADGTPTTQQFGVNTTGTHHLSGARADFTDTAGGQTTSLRSFPGGFGCFDDTYDYFSTDTTNGNVEFHQDLTCQKLTADWVDPRGVEIEAVAARPTEFVVGNRGVWVDSGDDKIYFWDGSTDIDLTGGGGTTANGTTVKMTGVQFLTNATTTALVWTAEVVDDLGWHSNLVNPTRITVDAAGWYHVHSNATYVVNTTGTRFLAIFINGVGKRQNTRLAVSTLGTACEVSGLFYLAASDYVEIKGYQNSTGGLSVGGSNELLASFSVVSA